MFHRNVHSSLDIKKYFFTDEEMNSYHVEVLAALSAWAFPL